MQIWKRRGLGARLAGLAAAIGSLSEAYAAGSQVFPAQPHLVPLVVAAVFVLPAAIAGIMSGFHRLWRRPSPTLWISLLSTAVIVAFAYMQPQLLSAIKI